VGGTRGGARRRRVPDGRLAPACAQRVRLGRASGQIQLDSLRRGRIPSIRIGGRAIPELAHHSTSAVSEGISEEIAERTADGAKASELERLQRAIALLVERFRGLRAENEALRARVADRDERLRELEKRRADALRRIDALVAQVDELDAKLEASETAV
jgi:hypothetical protein